MGRNCIKCGRDLQVIKSGFLHIINQQVSSSNLYGCLHCKRFQIHGRPAATRNVAMVKGLIQDDPGNPKNYTAILDPVIEKMPSGFGEYMKEYYPYWNWEGEDNS